MAIIHFSSGKTQEIAGEKFEKLAPELQARGIRIMRDVNEERILYIPLNSNTMEFIIQPIEKVNDIEPDIDFTPEEDQLKEMKADMEASMKEVAEKEDPEEKNKRIMDDMMAKSNCTHTNTAIYRQDTAKGSRYFPVCTFCGKRERYVKADSLTNDQKANSTLWVD